VGRTRADGSDTMAFPVRLVPLWFSSMRDDGDDPLWKEILTNEFLWVVVAAILILIVAFQLATR